MDIWKISHIFSTVKEVKNFVESYDDLPFGITDEEYEEIEDIEETEEVEE